MTFNRFLLFLSFTNKNIHNILVISKAISFLIPYIKINNTFKTLIPQQIYMIFLTVQTVILYSFTCKKKRSKNFINIFLDLFQHFLTQS